MIDGNIGHGVRFGHPKIDCGAVAALGIRPERTIIGYAAAVLAEMKSDATLAPHINARGSRYLSTVPVIVISP
jgi:hypothetical protein